MGHTIDQAPREPARRGSYRRSRTASSVCPRAISVSSSLPLIFALVLAAVGLAFWVYAPALNGAFCFDDVALPYGLSENRHQPFLTWISGVRPLLYLSFWLNYRLFGEEPLSFHLVNVIIHAINSTLVFWIAYTFLKLSQTPLRLARVLAVFGAGIFLFHPVQTESVAYVAGRSESLTAFFILSALSLRLKRLPGRLTWPDSAILLLLFLGACATKEHGMVLAAVLLLTDYVWSFESGFQGIKRNWRMYLPLGASGLIALAATWRVLAGSTSAGFALTDLSWYQYFFTECRVLFTYIRLFFLPVGQTVDYDIAASKTILEHGSIFGLLAIVALCGLAFAYRNRWRLASYGFFLFLVLLAPTSSFVPIRDPLAEHRMYLPLLGLVLVLLDALRLIRMPVRKLAAVCAVVLVLCGILSYFRSIVWSSPILLWQDAIQKAPGKMRPYVSLAATYVARGRCREASDLFQEISPRFKLDSLELSNWGESEMCLAQYAEAEKLFESAVATRPSAPALVQLGIAEAAQGKTVESNEAFARAFALDPSSRQAYVYRARWYQAAGRLDLAAADYQQALHLDPNDRDAREFLRTASDPIAFWQDAIRQAPTTMAPYANLGAAYLTRGHCQEAADLFQQASNRFHPDAAMLSNWGRAEICLAKYEDAEKLLAAAVGIQPNAAALVQLGIARAAQGKTTPSYEAFTQAIALDPSSHQAYLCRARWYQAAGRLDLAAHDFQRALELDPNDRAARESLQSIGKNPAHPAP